MGGGDEGHLMSISSRDGRCEVAKGEKDGRRRSITTLCSGSKSIDYTLLHGVTLCTEEHVIY